MTESPSAPAEASPRPHRGPLLLALGIASLFICWPAGIVVLVMAMLDLRAMDRGVMDSNGRGMTIAGLVLGGVGLCFTVLFIFGVILAFLFAIPTSFGPSGSSFDVIPAP